MKEVKSPKILLLKVLILTILVGNLVIFLLPSNLSLAAETYVYNATVGTDNLNRSLPISNETGNVRADRFVGIFYMLASSSNIGPYNMEYTYNKYPDAVYDNRRPEWGGVGMNHFWGTPLYGYYDHGDPWVMRKDMQMLASAGVDFIVFDTTNVPTFDTKLKTLLDIMQDMYNQGEPVPKIAFYTNTDSGSTMDFIYNRYYKTGAPDRHPDLWFNWRSKPLIIGLSSQASIEVSSFFTIKESQWPTEPQKENGFPWIDFVRPQPVYYYNGNKEVMSVSPAQNSGSLLFSDTAFFGLNSTWGRGYHNDTQDRSLEAVNYGYNFIEQWENAIAQDPSMIFVTAWNEWIAGIWDVNGNHKANAYDAATMESSRDVMPMKDGFNDNYYMQLVKYIREYKGFNAMPTPSGVKTITINSDFSQWIGVSPAYKDYVGDTADRDYKGYGALYYKNNTGRNDLDVMKLARDSNNVYFYVKCVDNITSYTDSSWMRLFINSDGNPTNGWNGFDYVINRTGIGANTTTLEKSTGGWNWSVVNSDISYIISGKEMMLKIPRSSLALNSDPVNIEFKWVDNMQTDGDIMDCNVNGDAAPDGRLRYAYYTDESAVSIPTPESAAIPVTAPIPESTNLPGVAKSWEFSSITDPEGWKVDLIKTDMYDLNASKTVVDIGSSDVAAEKFTAAEWFSGVYILAPLYSGTNYTGLRYTLYKWDTDYNNTLQGTPLMSYILNNNVMFIDGLPSNPWLDVWTQEAFPPGEYLWTLSLSSIPVQGTGVYKAAGSYSGATSFFNGSPITDHYVMKVYGPSADAFGVTEENALKGRVSRNNSYTVLKKDADIDLTDRNILQLRMSNATSASTAKLYFTTSNDVTPWDYDSSLQNWISNGHISNFQWQTGGYIGGNITGSDPFIFSPDGLEINAETNTVLKIKMRNMTASTIGQIYFTTNSDTNWSEDKSIRFPINAGDSSYTEYTIDMKEVQNELWSGTIKQIRIDPNKDVSSGSFSIDYVKVINTGFNETSSKTFSIYPNSDYVTYTIDMSSVPGWTGILKRIKLVPVVNASSGSFGIDYIRILNNPAYSWQFNTSTEDWIFNDNINNPGWQIGGYIGGTITGVDPVTVSPDNLGVSTSDNTIVRLKMKNSTASTLGQIYFTTNSDTTWSEAKSKSFTITANDGDYTEYFVDMSQVTGWTGTLKQLRVDPNEDVSAGSFSIDEVSISNAAVYTQSKSFSSTQGVNGWSYEEWSWNGANKTVNNMTWDAANGYWKGTTASCIVGSGWQQPDLNKESVQVFTAPRTGTIRILANARKYESNSASDGVKIKIMKNGLDYWPGEGGYEQVSDMTGIVIDRILSVNEGDKIQFIVNSKDSSYYDVIYFEPTIFYYAGVWNFDSFSENWTGGGNLSGFRWESGGYVGGSVTGEDPYLFSPDNLSVSITDNNFIKIRMKNSTSCTSSKFYFTTMSDNTWNEAKSKSFTIIANDPNYTEYVIDMSTVPGWTGTLKQLRFDPADTVSSGSFSIDYIRF